MDRLHHVFLFDIDGTLISSGGAGRRALERAFEAVHHIPSALKHYHLGGKTDPQIYSEVLAPLGITPQPEAFRTAYLEALREELPRHNGLGCVKPGVQTLLEQLSIRSDSLLGLLTGNWNIGADLKLSFYGLQHFFRFGAYGDDALDRCQLPRFAMTRARGLVGDRIGPETQFLVVGDTPRDVECAQRAGVTAVAVATGDYAWEELASHHPDHLFRNFTDTRQVLQTLGINGPDAEYPNCDAFLTLTPPASTKN